MSDRIKVVKDWTTEHGLRAILLTPDDENFGCLVGLPPEHPLHGHRHDQVTPLVDPFWHSLRDDKEPIGGRNPTLLMLWLAVCTLAGEPKADHAPPEIAFNVKGSITYSGYCEQASITDLVADFERRGEWWYGFRYRQTTADQVTAEAERFAKDLMLISPKG